MNTLADSIEQYKPAIKLTALLSRKSLSLLRKGSFAGLTICGLCAVATYFALDGQYSQQLLGGSFIFGALWLEQMLSFSYHNSYYFQGLNSIIGLDEEPVSGATYDVAEAVLKYRHDVTLAFSASPFGSLTLIRSGIAPDLVDKFLSSPRQQITTAMVMLPEDEIFSFADWTI